jgi:hypothetical protein
MEQLQSTNSSGARVIARRTDPQTQDDSINGYSSLN